MNKIPTYRFSDDYLKKIELFTQQFINDGFDLFAEEFAVIDSFVEMAKNDLSDRTDHMMRRSEKERYLLEMVSFKIYDQLNREAFNKQKHTLIIMPDCLSIHEHECLKIEDDHGDTCESCHPECLAYQITGIAEKYDIEVHFSKRKLSEQLTYYENKLGDTSVIGIACIMMLSAGMRVAREQNIPARGVLLNYTGCDHWNDKPFASDFSIKQLKNILEEKYGN